MHRCGETRRRTSPSIDTAIAAVRTRICLSTHYRLKSTYTASLESREPVWLLLPTAAVAHHTTTWTQRGSRCSCAYGAAERLEDLLALNGIVHFLWRSSASYPEIRLRIPNLQKGLHINLPTSVINNRCRARIWRLGIEQRCRAAIQGIPFYWSIRGNLCARPRR